MWAGVPGGERGVPAEPEGVHVREGVQQRELHAAVREEGGEAEEREQGGGEQVAALLRRGGRRRRRSLLP
eukprot:2857193-Rhodomonas_salina.2